jgi:hypothetical protein
MDNVRASAGRCPTSCHRALHAQRPPPDNPDIRARVPAIVSASRSSSSQLVSRPHLRQQLQRHIMTGDQAGSRAGLGRQAGSLTESPTAMHDKGIQSYSSSRHDQSRRWSCELQKTALLHWWWPGDVTRDRMGPGGFHGANALTDRA